MEGSWSTYDIVVSSVKERRVAIAGPYVGGGVVPSGLAPPMIGDPNGLLGANFDTRKIIENYGRAIIMASP
jgi:hypothetical protein